MSTEAETPGVKVVGTNRRAYFDYHVDESIECGIRLVGTEVKSIKKGTFNFSDSYARIKDDGVWLIGLHVTPYDHASIENHDPDRDRRLLLHKQEIKRLRRKVDEKGFTLIPLKFYLKRGFVKVDLGICKGKKQFDKRAAIKDRDLKREAQREIRGRF